MQLEDIEQYIKIEAIHPGYVIQRETIEQICKVVPTDIESYKKYQLELMNLTTIISRELDRLGRQYTVRTHHGEIVILTHADASKYNQKKFTGGIKKMKKANHKLIGIDVSQLTQAEREAHDSAIIKQSKLVSLIEMGSRPIIKPSPIPSGTRPNPLNRNQPNKD